MKYLFILLITLTCASVSAQKLYLHDIEGGNYVSYETGDRIECIIKDSGIIKGVITSFQSDGFTLNGTRQVKLAQVTAVVKEGVLSGNYTAGQVLLTTLGTIVLLPGAFFAIGGISLITSTNETIAGIIFTVIGSAIGYGGYAIIRKQAKKSQSKVMLSKEIDTIHYRLFIE